MAAQSCLRARGCRRDRSSLTADNAVCISSQEPLFYRQQMGGNVRLAMRLELLKTLSRTAALLNAEPSLTSLKR